MCLAVYLAPGAFIPGNHVEAAWYNNPDGAGFAYYNDRTDQIDVEKYMTLDELTDNFYERIIDFPKSPFILHFRFGTHGDKTVFNVHPFHMNEDTVFIHNGIINVLGGVVDRRSDTQLFNDYVLRDLPRNWLDNPNLVQMVEDYIGWSKLVFLTVDPELEHNVYILNEADGEWSDDKDVWYSNSSYKLSTYRHTTHGLVDTSKITVMGSNTVTTFDPDKCVKNHMEWLHEGYCYKCEVCLSCGGDGWHCECLASIADVPLPSERERAECLADEDDIDEVKQYEAALRFAEARRKGDLAKMYGVSVQSGDSLLTEEEVEDLMRDFLDGKTETKALPAVTRPHIPL